MDLSGIKKSVHAIERGVDDPDQFDAEMIAGDWEETMSFFRNTR